MITKTARRLVDIEQEIRAIKQKYFENLISYRLAKKGIWYLEIERERLWALE